MSRLPILMYHNVCHHINDGIGLTIAKDVLEAQFAYLAMRGYQTFHFSELKNWDTKQSLPKKSVVITFDDVYVNQLDLAYPLLKKYNLKATFFIPFKYVDAVDSWNSATEKIMSVDQLKSLDKTTIELGHHSYHHNNYNDLSIEEIEADFKEAFDYIKQHNLDIESIVAYPYGKYPRKNPEKHAFFEILKKHNINFGLRIGNRVNRFPFKNNYELQRIDIKGEDSLIKFKMKLKFGKLKLF